MIKYCLACRSYQLTFHGLTTCASLGVSQSVNLRRNLLKCLSCGSIIAFPRPSDLDLEKYYANYSEDGNYFTDSIGWKKRSAYHTISDICKRMGKGKVLDVGCADGELLSMLPSSFQKFGVDISENNRELAKKKGVPILYSSLEEATVSKKYDLVIALDYLEHIDNPKETINFISDLLLPGGYVVIETGNANSFFAKVLKEDWSYTTVYGHLCVLTPSILSTLAVDAKIHKVLMKTGWHTAPSIKMAIYRNILSFGFHAFRLIYQMVEPITKRVEYLRRLYEHAPPGAPHPDHMIFVGKKEL